MVRDFSLNSTVILLSAAQYCWHNEALIFFQALKEGPLQPPLSLFPASSSTSVLNKVCASSFYSAHSLRKPLPSWNFHSSSSLLLLEYLPSLWPGSYVKPFLTPYLVSLGRIDLSLCFRRTIGSHKYTLACENMCVSRFSNTWGQEIFPM